MTVSMQRHIACPECKGAVSATEVDRVVTCGYCGARSLVERERFVPEYYVSPAVEREDARRALQAFLRTGDLPEGLIKNTRFHSARLCMIPYHDVFARKSGVLEIGVPGERMSTPGQKVAAGQTKIIAGDLHRVTPGLPWRDWGLDEAGIVSSDKELRARAVPFDAARVGELGTVYRAEVSADKVLERLPIDARMGSVRDETTYEEIRLRRIYYPVWRLRYRYKGRLYGATVDGVSGKLMAARAPQGNRNRVIWLVGTMAFIGLNIGGPLSFLHGAGLFGLPAKVIGELGLWALAALVLWLFVLLFCAGVGWEQIRYRGEVVQIGERRSVLKINRPSRTAIDRLLERFSRLIGAYTQTLADADYAASGLMPRDDDRRTGWP